MTYRGWSERLYRSSPESVYDGRWFASPSRWGRRQGPLKQRGDDRSVQNAHEDRLARSAGRWEEEQVVGPDPDQRD